MPAARIPTDRIRSLRPAKEAVDPWRPLGVTVDDELVPGGGTESWLTVFLAGAECPFTCVYCDLWRYTLDGPTPAGALPVQIDWALEEAAEGIDADRAAVTRIKLYNASNFFEPRAVPASDLGAIARRLGGFEQVAVECHPRFVGEECREFARRLEGRLQVAMGLETVHPRALRRLGKQMSLDDFDRAAERLLEMGAGLRAFVLVGPPFVPVAEAVEWAARSVEHAFAVGVEVATLIPMRGGNGALEELAAAGDFTSTTPDRLERAVERSLELPGGIVLVDAWDLERLAWPGPLAVALPGGRDWPESTSRAGGSAYTAPLARRSEEAGAVRERFRRGPPPGSDRSSRPPKLPRRLGFRAPSAGRWSFRAPRSVLGLRIFVAWVRDEQVEFYLHQLAME